MHDILLLGAGKIGGAIARFLSGSGDYTITVADASEAALRRLEGAPNISTKRLDVTGSDALESAMRGKSAVVSALSFAFNPGVAAAAARTGVSYFDLTEDVATTRHVRKVAESAEQDQIFMPQCGLAPGFIGIVANDLTKKFDAIETVLMRVGALPMFPTNALKYNLTWSTDGLINEYCNPCEAIHSGRFTEALALEGLEHFSIDGVRYEAFNTSGGLGTLSETLSGKAQTVNYKTVRYPGHRDLAAFLIRELKLGHRRDLLKEILEDAIPMTLQDVVLVFATVTGSRNGRLTQLTDARKIYHGDVFGETWSAIQITTAAGVCAVVELHLEGKLPRGGFVKQEQVPLDAFLSNRFGQYYALDNETEVKVQPVGAVIETD